jgi:flagellar biosynthesis/type III secretory pathway chaperone
MRELIENLRETSQLYQQVLRVEREKQHCIVANEIPGLIAAVEAGRPLAERLHRLEESRLAFQDGFGRRMGLNDRPTIRQIAEIASPEESAELLELRSSLLAALDQLAQVHQTNSFLITRCLEVVDEVLSGVFAHLRQGATYEPSGRRQREQVAGSLLSRSC